MSTSDDARKGKLVALEAVIENWWVSTLEAAKALVEIKSTELYKETHQSFEEYVGDRFKRTKQWAYDLCNWYEVNLLARCKDDNLLSMAACRPLKPLRKNPEKVRKVVAEARKISKSPSVKEIEAAKGRVFPPKPKAPPKFCYDVMVTGTDLELVSAAGVGDVATITTEDEDSLDLQDVNLSAFFRLLAGLAAQNGTLKVSFAIEKHERTPVQPELAVVS